MPRRGHSTLRCSVFTGLVVVGLQLMLPTVRTLSGGQSVQRQGGGAILRPAATSCQVSPEGGRVKSINDGVAARVQVPKHKQDVVDVLGCDAEHVRLEPVPDPKQVVWRPAHHKGQDDDHRHLQCLHPSLRDDVSAAAAKLGFTC